MMISIAMKPSIEATAANKLTHVKYTGTSGLYSAVTPQPAYVDALMGIAEELGLPTVADSLHTTVIYSKVPPATQPTFDPERTYTGLVNAIEHWVGHNGKTYIVMKLVSEGIVDENAKFQRMGAKHTFVPFSPHITLSDEVAVDDDMKERIEKINNRLAYHPVFVTFEGQIVGDVD